MPKFSTLLFDIDDTLLDFKKTEKYSLENTFNDLKIDFTTKNIEIYQRINMALWDLLEKGKISKDKLIVERFRRLLDTLNIKNDALHASNTYINYLSQCEFMIEGAYKLCQELSKDYNISIVTNGIAKVQHTRIIKTGLYKFFDKVFISDEVGYAKPNIEFFDVVFAELNIKNKNEVIIIGDSLNSDMKGGNNAGIAACWYNPNKLVNYTDSICDYEIFFLDEIRGIIN